MKHQKTNLAQILLLTILLLCSTKNTIAQDQTPIDLSLLNGTWVYEGDGFKEGGYQLEESPAFILDFLFTLNSEHTSGTVQNKTLSSPEEKILLTQKGGIYFLEYLNRKQDTKTQRKASIVALSDTELKLLFEEQKIMEYFSRASQ